MLLLLVPVFLSGQQNQQLYQMHYLGESNFLNPAVQSECKIFIGLPLISSLHLNYANNAFSYRQLVQNTGDSTSQLQIDKIVRRLGRRTLIGTELHFTWLALGYKLNDYYFAFSIIEKNNIPITLSKDIFTLPWNGNTPFEGDYASSRGTAIYATHYREFAFGVSKETGFGNYIGLKGKLLFGKLNAATPKTDVSLYTDPTYFDLTLDGEFRANLSAPVIINEVDGRINSISFDENTDILQLIFNRKNWGVAVDAGFIQQVSDRVSASGSIVDLGFIRWRSNLNNLYTSDQYMYQGPLADTGQVMQTIMDSIRFDVTHDPYFTMLPLKLYLGADYAVTDKFSLRGLTSAVVYRTKFAPALTLGLDYNPFGHFHVVSSYSLMYRALNIVGLGFSLGRGPLQFYAVSDNAAGMIWPLSARNLNLRFGLNLNFGCNQKEDKPDGYTPGFGPCPVYESPLERQRRMRKRR